MATTKGVKATLGGVADPIAQANDVITRAAECMAAHTNVTAEEFKKTRVQWLADNGVTGDAMRSLTPTKTLDYAMVACAYALDAGRATDPSIAWCCVAYANRHLGYLLALVGVLGKPKAMSRIIGKGGGVKGGAARAADVEAQKKKLKKWCEGRRADYNELTKMGDAAHDAAIVKFDRGWIGERITEFAKVWRTDGGPFPGRR
jgi:hypothetical protein